MSTDVAGIQRTAARITEQIHRVIVGQDETVEQVLIACLSGGHALLEGVPGLGKTLLVRTLARSLDLGFGRIQFTPDLMPSDVIGTHIIHEDDDGRKVLRFHRGPVFAHVLLADEINRATPRTQSAMLEAMQEGQVTSGGERHELPKPFFVLATQNPLEMEGTYPLPEAQLDRFALKIRVPFPSLEDLGSIVDRTTGVEGDEAEPVATGEELLEMEWAARQVVLAPHVRDYAMRLVLSTHPDRPEAPERIRTYVRYGSSPRGAQSLVRAARVHAALRGREHVSLDDIRALALPVLRHRILRSFEGEAEGIETDDLIRDLVAAVPDVGPALAKELA